jgi:hypothetical protein
MDFLITVPQEVHPPAYTCLLLKSEISRYILFQHSIH